MKYILSLTLLMQWVLVFNVQAQSESPYNTKFWVDGPVTIGLIGVNGAGLYLISEKDGMTPEEVDALDENDVPKFDRRFAGNYDPDAKKLSDYPFYGSFVLPFTLLLDSDIRSNTGQTLALYVETMAVTGAMFTMANGLSERRRPLVYSDEVPMDEKTRKNAKNSFYAGHTAASAGACFFAAKVFNDYNPDSPWKPVVWAAAAAIPAGVGYLRLEAGKHFLSDNILGYALGAGAGILVPHLHKTSNNSGMSLSPYSNGQFSGVALRYKF